MFCECTMINPSKNRAHYDRPWCEHKTTLEKWLIGGMIVTSAVAISLFILLLLNIVNTPTKTGECVTKDCVDASTQLLDYISLSADPCDDFYEFSCGTYIANAVKDHAPSPFQTVFELFNREMKNIVVDQIQENDVHSNVLLKQFYQACMDTEKINADKDATFMEDLKKIGGWPVVAGSHWNQKYFDWGNLAIALSKLGLPFDSFFRFARYDVAEANKTILQVLGSGTIAQLVDENKPQYIKLMHDTAINLGASQGITSEINETVDFMFKLNEIFNKHLHDIPEIKTVGQLELACPHVRWVELINSMSNLNVTSDHEVAFNMVDYCMELQELLTKTSNRTQANYLIWTVVNNVKGFLSYQIRFLYQGFNLPKIEERSDFCYNDAVSRFQYVRETIYIRSKTNAKIRKELTEMIENIKSIYVDLVTNNDWMDNKTKDFGIEKTKSIMSVVGGADEMYDEETFDKVLGVDDFNFTSDNVITMIREKQIKDREVFFDQIYGPIPNSYSGFFTNGVQLNAFFARSINLMVLPAPILEGIFFNTHFPRFMNYGALGRIIGHELMHGFQKSARDIILDNDTAIDWWTNDTANAYDKKTQCVIDLYNNFPYDHKSNGTTTLEENVCDFVGVDAAYLAYLKWIKENGEEQSIPGVPYTPKQIYWIQSSTFFCFKKLHANGYVDFDIPNEHAVPIFRVNAGLQNSLYFAKDFNCPVGSNMNPEKKCRVM